MLYIVSGFMRSGTSMMMRALAAGGLEPAYRPERDQRLNDKWGDQDPLGYRPNDNYFELDPEDYSSPDFPGPYDGKLIKCLIGGLIRIRKCEARVVVMRRPRKEILASCMAAFGQPPPMVRAQTFDADMNRMVEAASDRRSFVSFHEVYYNEAVCCPLAVFETLEKAGWPINAAAAAAIPTEDRRRYSA